MEKIIFIEKFEYRKSDFGEVFFIAQTVTPAMIGVRALIPADYEGSRESLKALAIMTVLARGQYEIKEGDGFEAVGVL